MLTLTQNGPFFWASFAQIRENTTFFEKLWICQILASMDVHLSAKLQKKGMEQSWGMTMNVDFDPKWTLFWAPFAQIRANTISFKKNQNLSDFSLYGCPTSCKLQKKMMKQSWRMIMNVDFDPKWTLFWDPFGLKNDHECWLWPKMDPFLGPFCQK